MISIYKEDTIDFSNNGLGILRDVISCIVTEELNGRFDLELEYLIDGINVEYIIENYILKVPVANKEPQLFRIKYIDTGLETKRVTAYHITYDINDNFLTDVAPTNQTCLGALQWILDRTEGIHNFKAMSDITELHSARYVRKNVMEAILSADNSIVNVWNGELDRDNFTIYVKRNIGLDRGLKIIYGKNLNEISYKIDMSTIATKVLPQGAEELILPELFIESPLINSYPTPVVRKVEFSEIAVNEDEENPVTKEQAYEMLRDAVKELYRNGLDKPVVTVDINMQELSKIEEYKDKYSNMETVHIGDIVSVFVEEIQIDIKAEVISIQYDAVAEEIQNITIGKSSIDYFTKLRKESNEQNKKISEISDNIGQVKEATKDIINNGIPSAIAQAKQYATEQINNAMGGYIVKTRNELYILDNENISVAQKVWRWNLNGLGYSSTGISGIYETAITADGQIVANFITSGKLNGDIIEANSISINKISKQAQDKLASQVGIVNLVKNSSSLNSFYFWKIIGVDPISDNSVDVKENTNAKMAFKLTNTIMEQTINTITGKEYTICFKCKKGTGESIVKIIQAAEEIILYSENIAQEKNWNTIVKTFVTKSTTLKISIANNQDYLLVGDIILLQGGYAKEWCPAPQEIYADNTAIDSNGIVIANPSNKNRFIASSNTVGVSKGDQTIFGVDNETTIVKNLTIRDVEGSIVQVGKIQQIVRSNGVDFIYKD